MPSGSKIKASTSAIFAESYSFIWQPWVLMNIAWQPRCPRGRGGCTDRSIPT
jgi:hypothetical protein